MNAPVTTRDSRFARAIPFVIAVTAITALAAILLVPKALQLINHQKTLNAMQEELAVAEILFPFFAQLKASEPPQLAPALARDAEATDANMDISSLADQFAVMANTAGLEMRATIPKPYTLEDGRQFLQVQVATVGTFENFQTFMLAVTRMPQFIQMIETKVTKGEVDEELRITFWLKINM